MIRLRAIEREDLGQLRDWRNDSKIFSRVREYRYLNMENQMAWFDSLTEDRRVIMFGIEVVQFKEWDHGEHRELPTPRCRLVGVCGLTSIDWVSQRAEVSIYIGNKADQQMGFGSETLAELKRYAFAECNLGRLWAEIFEYNSASIALFKKAGFKEEGKMRRHTWKNGKWQDSIIMGLVAGVDE